MSQSYSAPRPHGEWPLTGIASLLLTIFLCLPSLIGGGALLLQAALYRDIGQWKETPSALIALGAILGGPLVGVAALIGAIISFSRLPSRFKYAHLAVIGMAAIATLSLLLEFSR